MSDILPNYAYFDGRIVPFSEAKVSVMTQALHYGTAVFGGMRGYWNDEEEQLYIVRPKDHFRRVLQSAYIMRMEMEENEQDFSCPLCGLKFANSEVLTIHASNCEGI